MTKLKVKPVVKTSTTTPTQNTMPPDKPQPTMANLTQAIKDCIHVAEMLKTNESTEPADKARLILTLGKLNGAIIKLQQ